MPTATALIERCHRLMAVRRTEVEEHEFDPIAAGLLMAGDRLIWGDRLVCVEALFFPTTVPKFVVTINDGSGPESLHLLTHEEVLVILPRPEPGGITASLFTSPINPKEGA